MNNSIILNPEHNHALPNYDQITPNIWIGNNMCCSIHGKELLALGFDADIDLEDLRPEDPPHTKIYLWLPTIDHTPPSTEQLHGGAAMLAEITKRKLKAYVHCRNGHGRAPTLVAAYLITTGMTARQAVELIKTKRPVIHLQDEQFKALEEFEKLRP